MLNGASIIVLYRCVASGLCGFLAICSGTSPKKSVILYSVSFITKNHRITKLKKVIR